MHILHIISLHTYSYIIKCLFWGLEQGMNGTAVIQCGVKSENNIFDAFTHAIYRASVTHLCFTVTWKVKQIGFLTCLLITGDTIIVVSIEYSLFFSPELKKKIYGLVFL